MKNIKTCPICGKETAHSFGNWQRFGLCIEHNNQYKKGEIVQCSDCGKWHKTSEICECKKKSEAIKLCTKCGKWHKPSEPCKVSITENQNDSHCVICGKPSNGKPQCKECYNETKNHLDMLDKNKTVRQLRDYYYNLKERIVIINSLDEAKNQCNKLIAIAMINQNQNDDTSLIDRVYSDVEQLLKKKANKQNTKFISEEKEKDQEKSKINTAQDGHSVDSDMEVRIDDILYGKFILHSYGQNIAEITEKRKKSDWFIPIANGKGIYIEYWGKNTPDYIADRKEKEELYKKHNIPYISIERDDPKQDTQTFTNNLLRELRQKAEEIYGFMPEWKK